MAQLQHPLLSDNTSAGKENFNIEDFINGLSTKSINSVSPINSTYNLISDTIFDDLIEGCHDESSNVFPPVYLNHPPPPPITVTKPYIPCQTPMFNGIPPMPYCLPMDIVPHQPEHIMSCWMVGHPVVTPPHYPPTTNIPVLHHKDLLQSAHLLSHDNGAMSRDHHQVPLRRPFENMTQQTWTTDPRTLIRKTPTTTPVNGIVKSEMISPCEKPLDQYPDPELHISPSLPVVKKARLNKKEHKTNPRAKRLLLSLTKPLLDHQRKGVDKITRTVPTLTHPSSSFCSSDQYSGTNRKPAVLLSSHQDLVSVILLIKSLYYEQSNPLLLPKRYKVVTKSYNS